MLKRIIALAAVAALPAMGETPDAEETPAPGPATVSVTFAENGGEQSVRLAPGQVVEIALPGNPTTGYGWTLEKFDAQDILARPMEEDFQAAAPQRLGAGGVFRFRFTAARAGSTTIRFLYRRAWEKDVAPLYIADLSVTVE
ncbi:MAG: protease inhibitor I42 family protein [Kiritimatiellae bacterium]|nr:protease inhibitor I42 family protein [Kiritimatiellia bacterium]